MKQTNGHSFHSASCIRLAMLAACLWLAGCKKEPFINTVYQSPYLAFPKGQQDLISLDVGRLRDKEFFRQVVVSLKETGDYQDALGALIQSMGSDPVQDIDRLVASNKALPNPGENPLKNTVFVAIGRFEDPGKKMQGIYQWLQNEILIAPPPFKEGTTDSGYKTYSLEAKSQYNEKMAISLNFGFPSDRIMVLAFNPGLLNDTLDVIAGKADGMRTDPAWLEMLKRPDLGAILWGTGDMTQMNARLAKVAPTEALSGVQQYFFSVSIIDEFTSEVGLVCSSFATAEQLTNGLRGVLADLQQRIAPIKVFLPELSTIPGKIVVLPEGPIVKIKLSLTDQQTSAMRSEWRRYEEQQKKKSPAPTPGSVAE